MHKMGVAILKILRRFLPASVRLRVRGLMFRWLDLIWTLPSGVRMRVANYQDWSIYNEVFVGRVYDAAILHAMETLPTGAKLTALDLGANVGYFALRLLDLWISHGNDPDRLQLTMVEGNTNLLPILRSRLFLDNTSPASFKIVGGLAGRRAGAAELRQWASHGQSSICSSGSENGNRPMASSSIPFVDLESLFAPGETLDLLKCDIEGSEELVFENYPDLLRRVRGVVMEFHHQLCDTDRCRRYLQEAGLVQTLETEQVADDRISIYRAWR